MVFRRRAQRSEAVRDRTTDPPAARETGQRVDGPATGYQPASSGSATSPQPGYDIAGSAPSAVALIAGLWLVVSRFVFDYPGAGAGSDGLWNGVVIGIAVALIAMVRMSTATSNPVLSLVNLVLGGWMIAGPWVFNYDQWGAGSGPAWSDVITGAAIAVFALASWSAGAASQAGTARRVATR